MAPRPPQAVDTTLIPGLPKSYVVPILCVTTITCMSAIGLLVRRLEAMDGEHAQGDGHAAGGSAQQRDWTPLIGMTTNTLCEVSKCLVAVVGYFLTTSAADRKAVKEPLRPAYCNARYGIPAILYAVDNVMFFMVFAYITPRTASLVDNSKIIVTALLFTSFLGRQISRVQWAAVICLMVGVMTCVMAHPTTARQMATNHAGVHAISGHAHYHHAQAPGLQLHHTLSHVTIVNGVAMTSADAAESDFLIGVGLCMLKNVFSCFANVWIEYLFKEVDPHLPVCARNVMLYSYGVAINVAFFLMYSVYQADFGGSVRMILSELTELSSTKLLWLVVVLNTVVGTSIALLLCYANNIIKVMLDAGVMLFNIFWAWLFFGFCPSPSFLGSLVLVIFAVYVYNQHKEVEGFMYEASSAFQELSTMQNKGRKMLFGARQEPGAGP